MCGFGFEYGGGVKKVYNYIVKEGGEILQRDQKQNSYYKKKIEQQ
jgi:hypothetical protein